ncbi:MAG: lipopolysaccharide biosynthesis protein, partial [Acidimicrobiales bacterium]
MSTTGGRRRRAGGPRPGRSGWGVSSPDPDAALTEEAIPATSPSEVVLIEDPVPTGGAIAPAELQRRAMSGSFWTGVHTIVSVPLAFVANILVARVLGPASFGSLTVLSMLMGVAVIVTNAGVSDGVIQWGAAADAAGLPRRGDRLLGKSLGWHLGVQFPVLAVMVLVLGWGKGPLVVGALLLAVLLPAAFGGAALSISIENRTAAAARLTMLGNVALQLGVVLVAYLTVDAVSVWAARLCILALLVPFNYLLIGGRRRRAALRPRLPLGMPEGFWRFGLFGAGTAVIALLATSRSEIFILQLASGATTVGLFSVAFGLAAHITAPIDGILAPLIPAAAALLATAPQKALPALLRATRFSSLLCGLVTGVGLPVLVVLVPKMYGPSYSQAAAVLVPLGLSSCMSSVLNPVSAMLRARRLAGAMFAGTVASLVVDAALAFSLIPLVGLWGAVAANVAASVAISAAFVRVELRASGMALGALVGASRAWIVSLPALAAALGA